MIYVILGPTGSGKTKAVNAIYPYLNVSAIINADAFQVYKDMDIGTAKLEKDDPLFSKYHLLDFLSPEETFSIQEYQTLFRNVMDKYHDDNEDIIVIGGSGLYVRSALYDYSFVEYENEVDMSDLEEFNNEQLFEKLREIDAAECEKLHPNNRKRVLQAIRISRLGKGIKSELIAAQKHELVYKNVKFICLNPSRELLYENINKRVDVMINNGLVEEVKSLLRKYNLSTTAKAAIGYKEIIDYLEGKCSLEEAVELIKKRSRNYAKRQMTFFRHQFDCIMYNDVNELIKDIKETNS